MSPAEHVPYFFVDPELVTAERVEITGPDARHLSVRRAAPGDLIRVSDGAGAVVEARIDEAGSDRVSAVVLHRHVEEPPQTALTVFQGLAKGAKVDRVVEKLVELGVDEVVVFAAGRSVPVWDEAKRAAVLGRWRRVAVAASKQSHRSRIPPVRGPITRDQAVEKVGHLGLALVGDPQSPDRLRDCLPDEPVGRMGLVVGPEGGLDGGEVQQFRDAGARPVALGPQVLRTETAGLAMSAVVLFHLGRLG